MLRQGMHFEYAVLARMILEQIAWVHAVHRIPDEGIFAVKPQSAISSLKRTFPAVGRLYGILSEQAHIAPELTTRYINWTDKSDPAIEFSLPEYRRLDLLTLSHLADMYVVSAHMLAASFLGSFGAVRVAKSGEYIVKKRRPSLTAVHSIQRAVDRSLARDGAG